MTTNNPRKKRIQNILLAGIICSYLTSKGINLYRKEFQKDFIAAHEGGHVTVLLNSSLSEHFSEVRYEKNVFSSNLAVTAFDIPRDKILDEQETLEMVATAFAGEIAVERYFNKPEMAKIGLRGDQKAADLWTLKFFYNTHFEDQLGFGDPIPRGTRFRLAKKQPSLRQDMDQFKERARVHAENILNSNKDMFQLIQNEIQHGDGFKAEEKYKLENLSATQTLDLG